jgi:formimidoylglutamate deiminase|tara:strand:+ start:3070 stop:4440 length:1371 start_codon:yes stop_codon:yes gene_type:complete
MDQVYFANQALISSGWANNVKIIVTNGVISHLETNQTTHESQQGCHILAGPVLPGMVNLHSHAFQRAMAGLAEVCLDPQDSFWSWRDLMYGLVAKLNPQQVGQIATYLYIEMLKAGYTQVAEFHYLHHQQSGQAYDNPAEMALQVRQAAVDVGIGQTLLPVLYSHSGFGGQAPNGGQTRFIHDLDGYLRLQEQLGQNMDSLKHNQGLCFHSLRAVTKSQMQTALSSLPQTWPVHIHIAEQTKEVDDCIAWSGQRPVEWLANEVGFDARWCLIHATHVSQQEVKIIADSQAVVGLCPSTEANLGDGIFPITDLIAQGGRFGVGSDSHVCVSVAEELRLLEYGQRLRDQQRNRVYSNDQPSVGDFIYQTSAVGGNAACNINTGLRVGARADFITLDTSHPLLASAKPEQLINRWTFGINHNPVRDVFVAGEQVVAAGCHNLEDAASTALVKSLKELLA